MSYHSVRILGPFSDLFYWRTWLLPIGLAIFLIFVSFHNYLLFHTAAELFAVVIGVLLFVVAWQTYSFSQNSFLMYLGCGYFWIAVLDGVHTLVYKGMTVFPIAIANPATQFWIATRYSEALLLLGAPLFLDRAIAKGRTLLGFGLIAVVLYALIMTGNFPDAFIDGQGLTPFKVTSEYVIVVIMAGALAFLVKRRALMEPRVFALLTVSIILTMAAELAFTFYVSVYGLSNLVGHIFKLFSFWLIFVTIVRQSLTEPYSKLEQTVKERTGALQAEITEHKQTEEALQVSEQRFRRLFERAPLGYQSLDEHGCFIEVNQSWLDMLGYSREEVIDRSFGDFIAPEYQDLFKTNFPRFKAAGETSVEFEMLRKSGEPATVSFVGRIGYDEAGGFKQTHCILTDITERKLAEKALKDLGHPQIDDQHRRIFVLANALDEAVKQSKEDAILDHAFDLLLQYTNKHFSDEEALYEEMGSALLKAHRDEHRRLLDDIREMWNEKRRGLLDDPGVALEYWVERRLIPHIVESDPAAMKATKK